MSRYLTKEEQDNILSQCKYLEIGENSRLPSQGCNIKGITLCLRCQNKEDCKHIHPEHTNHCNKPEIVNPWKSMYKVIELIT